MRIGWSIPLGGPFRLTGTVWRSKSRRRGYHGTLQNPRWTCPHNHSRPDLAQACAEREARRRAPAIVAQRQAEAEAAAARQKAETARQAMDAALTSMEQAFHEQITVQGRVLAAEDAPAVRAALDNMGKVIDESSPILTRRQRRQARERLGRLRAQFADATAGEPQAEAGTPQAPAPADVPPQRRKRDGIRPGAPDLAARAGRTT